MGKNPNIFNQVKLSNPPSSKHDLSHVLQTSLNFGNLVPVLSRPMLPGQSIHLNADVMMRLAPLTAPVFGRARVYMHFFFVPNRIMWDGWQDYIMQQQGTNRVHPFLDSNGVIGGSYTKLWDYLDIPPATTTSAGERVDAFPFGAYQKIYNDWFRDENLVTPSLDYDKPFLTDGDNISNFNQLSELHRRAWKHDYFTSALPFTQKGSPVQMPIGTFQDVEVYRNESLSGNITWNLTSPSGQPQDVTRAVANNAAIDDKHLFADTSTLVNTAATINDLRRAFAIQRFLERNAVGGTRYIEFLMAHFKVSSSDKRLQRSEFITSTKANIMISEVLSTTQFDNGTDQLPQGNMSGHGLAIGNGKTGSYFAEEHGWLIGVMSVLPEPVYSQGIDALKLKTNDPYEYGFPLLAHLGEEAIKNRELFAFDASSKDTFGYKSRYAEYKTAQSRVAADFRSTLRSWTFARQFTTMPTLSKQFIECDNAETDHVFAVVDDKVDHLWAQIVFNIRTRLPLPYFGTPGGI